MTNNIKQAIIGGIIATAIMTLFTMLAPMMGLPKMNIPEMLVGMLGIPIAVAWFMHFMIGTIFAFSYALFFIKLVKKIDNKILRGVIFGIAVFIFAQIAIASIGAMTGGMPPMMDSIMLLMLGSLIGHIVYGITVALFVKDPSN